MSNTLNKSYNVMYNVGKVKYLVNYHNGIKLHNDNSKFYDIKPFSNKKELNKFIKQLDSEAYKKEF